MAAALPSKTENMLLFHCPACTQAVHGKLTMAFDLKEASLPSAPELNQGQAQVQVAVRATGMVVSHNCSGPDTAPAPAGE